jgi:hypothetical protein
MTTCILRHRWAAVGAIALTVTVWGVACGGESDEEADTFPPSQQLSQPCSPEWGIDACGAGLLCAALDGRKRPTCYPLASRFDGTECSEDAICASQKCSAQKKCAGSPYTECTKALGCGPAMVGGQFSCVELEPSSAPICRRVDLSTGAACQYDAECGSGTCFLDGTCE